MHNHYVQPTPLFNSRTSNTPEGNPYPLAFTPHSSPPPTPDKRYAIFCPRRRAYIEPYNMWCVGPGFSHLTRFQVIHVFTSISTYCYDDWVLSQSMDIPILFTYSSMDGSTIWLYRIMNVCVQGLCK